MVLIIRKPRSPSTGSPESCRSNGNYTAAEPLLLRALAIREKRLGPEHTEVATTLNNLAALYRDMGDHAKAEPLLLRDLAITEKGLGPNARVPRADVHQSGRRLCRPGPARQG